MTEIDDLHRAILAGHEAALGQIMAILRPRLRRQLRAAFTMAGDIIIDDAVEDALCDYALRPQAFDPARALSLDQYLYVMAWRNAADLVRSAQRRRVRENDYVAASTVRTPTGRSDRVASRPERRQRLLSVAANPFERKALLHWLGGERRTPALAEVLGVADLSLTNSGSLSSASKTAC